MRKRNYSDSMKSLKEYGKCKMVSVEYIHSWCANSIEVKTDLAVGVA